MPLTRHALSCRLAPIVAVLALALIAAAPGQATPKQDIAGKRQQAQAARAELAKLGAELEPAIERYNKAVVELQRVEERIAFNKKQIAVTQQNLRVAQAELGARLEQAYRAGDIDLVTTLLGQQSLSQVLAVTDLFDRTQRQAATMVGGLRTTRATLRRQKRELAAAEERAAQLKAERASERAAIASGIAQQKQIVSGLEGEIQQLIEEEQARQREIRRQALAALAAQQAQAQADAGGDSVDVGGSVGSDASGGGSDGGSGGDGGGSISLPPTDGSVGAGAVAAAMQYLGVPYVWGGASPSGFDCSGLTMYAYAQVGISLSHYTGDQWNEGTHVPADQLLPGDLVFFGGDLHHVGMYIGNGQFIQAPQTGDVVKITALDTRGDYAGAVRPY